MKKKSITRKLITGLCLATALTVGVGTPLAVSYSNPVVAEAASNEDWLVDCTEKEAYEKGYDFYRAWYIINKGNFKDLVVDYISPYASVVINNRNDNQFKSDYAFWKIMTYDFISNPKDEVALYVRMLYNLLQDNTGTVYTASSSKMTELMSDLSKSANNMGFSAWEKILGALNTGNKIELMNLVDNHTIAELEEMDEFDDILGTISEISEFQALFKKISNISKYIDKGKKLSEIIELLSKLSAMYGSADDISKVFLYMSETSSVNDSYNSALKAFSEIAEGNINNTKVIKNIMSVKETDMATTLLQANSMFGSKVPLIKGASGLFIWEDTGQVMKFVCNGLFGTDEEFNRFDQLLFNYDMECMLRASLYRPISNMEQGDDTAGSTFMTAYGMLKKMYLNNLDAYVAYADAAGSREGFFGRLLRGLTEDKHNKMLSIVNERRDYIEKLYTEDIANADKAYSAAAIKWSSKKQSTETNVTVPKDIKSVKESYENNKYSLGCHITNEEYVLNEDMEIFGNLTINDGGSLKLNGHKMTVYGNAYINGNLYDNGILDIKGDVYHNSGDITITGARQLLVGGNFYENYDSDYDWYGATLVNGGSLDVTGDIIINNDYYYNELTISSGGEVKVGGELKFLDTGHDYVYGQSGRMTVGKGITFEGDNYFSGTPDFTLTLAGTDDVKLRNISGMNLVIENASKRNITFAGDVIPATIAGGDMTIKPDNLKFGAALKNNVTISGDVTLQGDTNPGNYKLTINGNVSNEYGRVQIDPKGIVEINGNYVDNTGDYDYEITVNGGKLSVTGDYIIKENDTSYSDLVIKNNGEVNIGGNLKDESGTYYATYVYGEKGKMKVGKSVLMRTDCPFYGTTDFTLTLAGTGDVTVKNVDGMNLVIENASSRKIAFAENVTPATISGGNMTITPKKLTFAGRLKNDVTISGATELSGYCNPEDHTLTINGNTKASGQLQVNSKGNVVINGNFTDNNWYAGYDTEVNGGNLTVTGDYILGEGDYDGYELYIHNNGTVNVGGDVKGQNEGSYWVRGDKGRMNVGKNVLISADYDSVFSGSSDFTLTLTGTEAVKVQNVEGVNLVIENASKRDITFADMVQNVTLSGGNMTVKPENLNFCGTLKNDLTINGDVKQTWYETNLSGHKLTINGNLTTEDGTLNLNKGTATINGNYNMTGWSNINMIKAEDRLNVKGNMVVDTGNYSELTNGVMSLAGNFTQKGDERTNNFAASGKHKAVLNGTKLQRITFGTAPDSHFNIVETTQKEENYVFSPDDKWKTYWEVSGVSLDKTTLELTEGGSTTLKATVAPEKANNKNVTWSSDNESVALVNKYGKITAMKAGKAKITVTTAEGKKTASCTVTVKAKEKQNGVYSVDGRWIYLKDGVHDTTFTGIAKSSKGNWIFVKDGVYDAKFTGIAKSTKGNWLYAKNGRYDTSYTGVAKSTKGNWLYVTGGRWDTKFTGVAKAADGRWLYVKDGRHDNTFTGAAKSTNGNWIYVNKGVYTTGYSGVTKATDGKWLYMKNGRHEPGFTGVAKSDKGNWIYVKNGVYDTSFTGVAKSTKGNWIYVKNGRYDANFTGISQSTKGNKLYIVKGRWQNTYTGKYQNYNIKNGYVI